MLLGSVHPDDEGKKTLVLDLDGTLVHTSFEPAAGSTFELHMTLDGAQCVARVACRPHVERFLDEAARMFELVVFTAASQEYADLVIDRIDPRKRIRHRRYRQHCVAHHGVPFVKDLAALGRPLEGCLIVDDNPDSYLMHWHNAVDCSTFARDEADEELRDILRFLRIMQNVKDVRRYCAIWRHPSIVARAVCDEMIACGAAAAAGAAPESESLSRPASPGAMAPRAPAMPVAGTRRRGSAQPGDARAAEDP
jgi:RNA polymerase II subunit A small phosphatase-like protein